jgi:hypothetical protein
MLRWVSKSGTFIQFAIYTVLLLLLWIPAFVNPVLPVITPADGPLYSLIVSWIAVNASLTVSLALLFVVIQSLILFYVFQANGFFGRSNFLPAIIVLLSYSWNVDYQTMHALLPAIVLIILAVHSVIAMYGQQAAYRQVFTAGFSLGIAALFYIPLVYLLPLIWLTLITYRIFSWREYVISVIGFSLPLLYYFSWLFWNDTLIEGINQLATSVTNFTLPARLSLIDTIWLSASVFILVVTMIAVLNIMNDKIISIRRRSWVLFNFSFTSLIVIFLAGWPFLSANYLFVIPMSFFVTGSLSLLKRRFWFEVLAISYFLLFLGIRVFQAFEYIV